MNKLNGYELLEMVREVNNYDASLEEYNYYYMDELDDIFYDTKPSDMLNLVADGFSVYADYFKFDGLGHIESYHEYEMLEELEADQDYILEVYEGIKEFL